MSAGFVLDCSMTMSWCFGDEAALGSMQVLDRLVSEAALVPALWFLEVTNVLAIAERRKRITAAKSMEFLTLLGTLDVEVDHEAAGRAFTDLLPLCRRHGLSSYDAAYLDLSLRRRLPLASLDDEIRKQAKDLGVGLLGK